MAYLLVLKCLESFAAIFFKKTSAKSNYLFGITTSLITNKTILAVQAGWIKIFKLKSKKVT